MFIYDKVLKNVPSRIYGTKHLKNVFLADHLGGLPQTLLGSFLDTLSHFYSLINCKNFFNYANVL